MCAYADALGLSSISRLAMAGALAAAIAQPAWAQEKAAPAAAKGAQPNTADDTVPQEIVVTANKRAERLLDVPSAVTAINATELLSKQQTSITDYYTRVPGLSISGSGIGKTSIAIRGITTGNTQHATVGIVIDDIPFTSTGGTSVSPNITPDLDPAILQRIEVLRGPQGTLYGAATLGGLLKFVTAEPRLTGKQIFAQSDVSDVDHGDIGYSARGEMNTALIPGRLGLSVNGFYRRDPGFVDDASRDVKDNNVTNNYGGRAELKLQVSDSVDARVGALIQDSKGHGQDTIRTDYKLDPIDGLDYPTFPGVGDHHSQIQFYSGIINADLSDHLKLTSLTGLVRNKYVQDTSGTLNQFAASTALFGVNGNYIQNFYTTRKFSQEVRLAGSLPKAIEWMLGAFYTNEKSYSRQDGFAIDPVTGDVPGQFFEFFFPSTFKEKAVFGDLTWHITNRFQLEGGLRHSQNHQTYFEADTGPRFPTPVSYDKISKDKTTTFLISSKYNITDDAMIYARVASGYRPGGPQTAAFGPVVPPQVNPDTTINYELGAKGRFLDKHVTLEMAIFQVDWKDIQLSQRIPGYGLFYVNGGKARVQGVEADAQVYPVAGLAIAGNIAYTDAKLRNDGIGFVASRGDPLPWSAKWSWNLSTDYDFPVSANDQAFLGATIAYVGDRHGEFPTTATNVRQFFPHYTTVDAHLGIRLNDRYTATLFVKNMFDKLGYLSSAVIQGSANTTSLYATAIIRPRTVGASIAANF